MMASSGDAQSVVGQADGVPPAIRVQGLRKNYGGVVALAGVDLEIGQGEFFTRRAEQGEELALAGVDLEIGQGEFFTLLGPSGSGKTTLLRLIAGFERPDGGTIELAGREISRVPPYARNVNTVFQDYALFPHMTVAENIQYAMKVRRVGREERLQLGDR